MNNFWIIMLVLFVLSGGVGYYQPHAGISLGTVCAWRNPHS
jgi:hypothetical protein